MKPRKRASAGFIRRTITLPSSLFEYALDRSSRVEHSGNMSGYIRTLILADAEKQKTPVR